MNKLKLVRDVFVIQDNSNSPRGRTSEISVEGVFLVSLHNEYILSF